MNLIPITSKAQARELGRKGGSVRSRKKSEAAKLRELRKRSKAGKLTNKDHEWVLAMMNSPECMAFDILLMLDQMRNDANTFKEKLGVIKLYMNFHKMWHSDKKTVVYQEPIDFSEVFQRCEINEN